MVRGDTAALIRSFVETGIKLSNRGFSTGVTASMKSVITGKVTHIGGFASIAVLLPLVNYMLVTNAIEIDASLKTFWNGGKVVGNTAAMIKSCVASNCSKLVSGLACQVV